MSALNDLIALIESLPVGAAISEATKANLLAKAQAIGTGAPLRAEGSGYDALGRALFDGPGADFHPAPAGPYEPPPPPPPPVVAEEPPKPTE